MKKLPKNFDKYEYYAKAVQSPDADTEFFERAYMESRGKKATVLREDFCGTFELSRSWVRMNKNHVAYGIDLDPEPIKYGRKREKEELDFEQQERLKIFKKNVLAPDLPMADIIAALNFSYFIFKTRKDLKTYFENCLDSLHKDGILLVDIFGGSMCYEPNEDETPYDGFKYYWDQEGFNPVTNEAMFYIHFKPKGKKKIKKVFTYDWRIWSVPEIREIMEDAGFKKTNVYWEGTTKKGEGDGNFQRVQKGEDCESWIAYITGEK